MNIEEFNLESKIHEHDWVITQGIRDRFDTSTTVAFDSDGTEILEEQGSAVVWKSACATLGGVVCRITYASSVTWEGTANVRYGKSYSFSRPPNEPQWAIRGCIIDDDVGVAMFPVDLENFMRDSWLCRKFSLDVIEVESMLPVFMEPSIDISEKYDSTNSLMSAHEIQIDNEPNIRFEGELIAEVQSDDSYIDRGRWKVFKLWRTPSGKFVCQTILRSSWGGESDGFCGKVCLNDASVIDFFGHSALAKRLYRQANISDVIVVD